MVLCHTSEPCTRALDTLYLKLTNELHVTLHASCSHFLQSCNVETKALKFNVEETSELDCLWLAHWNVIKTATHPRNKTSLYSGYKINVDVWKFIPVANNIINIIGIN